MCPVLRKSRRISIIWLSAGKNIKNLPFIGLVFTLLFGLSGCQGKNPLSQASDLDILTPAHTLEQPSAGISNDGDHGSQPVSTAGAAEFPTPAQMSPAPVYFTPTPGLTPFPEVSTALSMCSPLEDHSLADLQEIITFQYDPPPPGKDTGHHGVDFAYYRRGERLSIQGVLIQSVLAGRVAAVNENLIPYGYMVIVETQYEQLPQPLIDYLGIPDQRSLYLLYAHMHEPPLPAFGEEVACGQTLGAVGNTPEHWSSAPHLHFEARYGPAGLDFSGMRFYDPHAHVDEMEIYTLWRTSGEFVLLDPVALLNYGLTMTAHQGD
jgi:murein DD-endopeptidase MepM/ murein hydrolase activator NlpD